MRVLLTDLTLLFSVSPVRAAAGAQAHCAQRGPGAAAQAAAACGALRHQDQEDPQQPGEPGDRGDGGPTQPQPEGEIQRMVSAHVTVYQISCQQYDV